MVIGAALVLAAALIAASLVSAREGASSPASAQTLTGASEVAGLLRGIPQHGTVLGPATAPVTLVQYADLQCPYCGMWERNTLPVLVRDYVRTGKLRIEFRGLAFIGADSEIALRTALAAASQNRLWNVVELLYLNQGVENSGWVTPSLLGGIVRSAGVDPKALSTEIASPAVGRLPAQATAAAQAANVHQTPTFEIGRTGQPLHTIETSSLSPPPFQAAVQQALSS
jgi:protein-disulfide isomerase